MGWVVVEWMAPGKVSAAVKGKVLLYTGVLA